MFFSLSVQKVFTFNGQRVEGCHIDAIYQYKYAQLWHNILINCLRVAPCISPVKIPLQHVITITMKSALNTLVLSCNYPKLSIKLQLNANCSTHTHTCCMWHMAHTHTTELTIKWIEDAQVETRRLLTQERISGAGIDDTLEVRKVRILYRTTLWHTNHFGIILRVVAVACCRGRERGREKRKLISLIIMQLNSTVTNGTPPHKLARENGVK